MEHERGVVRRGSKWEQQRHEEKQKDHKGALLVHIVYPLTPPSHTFTIVCSTGRPLRCFPSTNWIRNRAYFQPSTSSPTEVLGTWPKKSAWTKAAIDPVDTREWTILYWRKWDAYLAYTRRSSLVGSGISYVVTLTLWLEIRVWT